MATYVDGFVFALPKKKLAAYRKIAATAGKVWRKHGALDYKECVIEDGRPKGMPGIPFSKLVKAKPGETVVFSFIVYKSRAHRDAVNKKVMNDPAMKVFEKMEMPVDMKVMSYAGFRVLVDA